jgi:hypothetical protein
VRRRRTARAFSLFIRLNHGEIGRAIPTGNLNHDPFGTLVAATGRGEPFDESGNGRHMRAIGDRHHRGRPGRLRGMMSKLVKMEEKFSGGARRERAGLQET